jgi:hypothetical protein
MTATSARCAVRPGRDHTFCSRCLRHGLMYLLSYVHARSSSPTTAPGGRSTSKILPPTSPGLSAATSRRVGTNFSLPIKTWRPASASTASYGLRPARPASSRYVLADRSSARWPTRRLSWRQQPPSILLPSQTHDREAAALREGRRHAHQQVKGRMSGRRTMERAP